MKDFQLLNRLFKNRCSYMIYSPSFDALAELVRNLIYERLHDVLTGEDTSPEFEHLGTSERKRILQILKETKEGLPESWF